MAGQEARRKLAGWEEGEEKEEGGMGDSQFSDSETFPVAVFLNGGPFLSKLVFNNTSWDSTSLGVLAPLYTHSL